MSKTYQPQPYPKMLFHESGRNKVVQSAQEHADLGEEYSETPFPVPPQPPPAGPKCANCSRMQAQYDAKWAEVNAELSALKADHEELIERHSAPDEPIEKKTHRKGKSE